MQATATQSNRVELIARGLAVFIDPDQVVELRGLHFPGGRKIRCEFFTGRRLTDMAARALEWEAERPKGLYFTPNALRPDITGSPRECKDADVIRRRWLLVDVDSARPDTSQPATEAERQAAWQVVLRVAGELEARGLAPPVVGDSGNGWHLNYPIDWPNDDAAKQRVRTLLYGLRTRCEDKALGVIGVECHNAARIWRLYGTWSRKGADTPERPHRLARLIQVPKAVACA